MNNFLIFSIAGAGVVVLFKLGKELFKRFLDKKNNQYFQKGFDRAATGIYNQVKEKGKIDLILDGNKLTLVALKEKTDGRNHK